MAFFDRKHEDRDVQALLDNAADLLEEGDLEGACEQLDGALQRAPRSPRALVLRADAHLMTEELPEAQALLERALDVAPKDPTVLFAAADFFLTCAGDDPSLVERALDYARKGEKVAGKDAEAQLDFVLLQATALNELGRSGEAVPVAERAMALDPDSLDARLERAVALFESCRFDEAKQAFDALVRDEPEEPWPHHYLGMLAERRRDDDSARAFFAQAHELDPERFPTPVHLSDEAFDQAVKEAIALFPDRVKRRLDNTTISVKPLPSDDDLMDQKPPLSPGLLGVFKGTPIGERSVASAVDHFPAIILLFQRNLERAAATREELIEQIRITVEHEVGHLLGLDEDDLWERGLD